ncbi:MAG: SGNH/GDSL hydrolase family protein [Chitinophagaceae bacterium]
MYRYQKIILAFSFCCYSFYAEAIDFITFSWSMKPRFNECRRLYDINRHEYDRKIMDFSDGWVVEFISSGNSGNIPDKEYVWEIQGLGNLSAYKKIYVTNRPNLITSLSIVNGMPITKNQPVLVKANNPVNDLGNRTIRDNNNAGEGNPQPGDPIPLTWFAGEKLPETGTYRIKLTVRSRAKGYNGSPISHVENITLRNIVIVCLGDSFASGEGNPDQDGLADWDDKSYCINITVVQLAEGDKSDFVDLQQPAKWFEKAAHRSMKSGYALAAAEIENRDPHSVVTFINLAVSGAEIQNGLLQPQEDRTWMRKGQLGYLSELVGSKNIDLLLLSIGGNDIGFSDLLKETTTGELALDNLNSYLNRINSLKDSYNFLNLGLRDQLNVKNILIAEYPTQLFSNNYTRQFLDSSDLAHPVISNQFSCELFKEWTGYLSIRRREIENLNIIGEKLKSARIEAASKHGWLYAGGIADKFKNHGYCSTPDQTYWITASYSCTNEGDTRGTMHPNQKGHAIIKTSVLEKIIPLLFSAIERVDDRSKTN